MKLKFLYLLIISFSKFSQQRELIFNDVRKNTKLYGYVVKTVKCKIIVKCLQHCVLENQCRSTNINIAEERCELMAGSLHENTDCGVTDEKHLKGWTYYGQELIKSTSKRSYCDMTGNDIIPKKGQLLNTLPILSKSWYLTFHVKQHPLSTAKGNLFHATNTIQNERSNPGDKIPAIWLIGSKINIAFLVNNTYFETGPKSLTSTSSEEYINTQVMQVKVAEEYRFQVYINNDKIVDVVNNIPREFHDVKIYLSNRWFTTVLNTRVKNLIYQNV